MLLVACNGEADPKELPFEVAYAHTQNGSDAELISYIIDQASSSLGGEMLTAKVDSVQELIDLSNANKYPFFDINFNPYFSQSFREYFYNSPLSQTIRAYDDLFFQEKSLVLVFIYFPNYWIPARIEFITVKGNVMNIVIARPDENYAAEALTEHAFLIEVAKKDVKGVDTITKQIIRKGKHEDYINSEADTGNSEQDEINGLEKFYSNTQGKICLLEYAYEQGILSAEDIRSIGYYHNGGKEWTGCKCGNCNDTQYNRNKCLQGFEGTDYQPIDKNPAELDFGTQEGIKQIWIDFICSVEGINSVALSIDKNNISIKNYYGTYGGYAAVMLDYGPTLQVIATPTIADTVFYYNNSNRILLWKES